MRRSLSVLTTALVLAMPATAPAAAGYLTPGGMTGTELADWLRQHGYPAQVKPDPTTPGDQIISSSVDGVNFDIYLYNCVGQGDARRCATIQYTAGWTGSKATVDKVNAWDRDKRYIRAYLNENGDLFGQYDLDISPGGTTEGLDFSLERWHEAIGIFKTYFSL